jgi:hypothetical protein
MYDLIVFSDLPLSVSHSRYESIMRLPPVNYVATVFRAAAVNYVAFYMDITRFRGLFCNRSYIMLKRNLGAPAAEYSAAESRDDCTDSLSNNSFWIKFQKLLFF